MLSSFRPPSSVKHTHMHIIIFIDSNAVKRMSWMKQPFILLWIYFYDLARLRRIFIHKHKNSEALSPPLLPPSLPPSLSSTGAQTNIHTSPALFFVSLYFVLVVRLLLLLGGRVGLQYFRDFLSELWDLFVGLESHCYNGVAAWWERG